MRTIVGTIQERIRIQTNANPAPVKIHGRAALPFAKKNATSNKTSGQIGAKTTKKSARLSYRIAAHPTSDWGGLRLKCGTTIRALKSWPPNQAAAQMVASQRRMSGNFFIGDREVRLTEFDRSSDISSRYR